MADLTKSVMKLGVRVGSRKLRITHGRQTAFTIMDQVASGASNLLLVLVVAKVSSTQEFGQFSLLITSYTTGLLICRAAVGQVLVIKKASDSAMPGALGAAVAIGMLASLVIIGLSIGGVVPSMYAILALVGFPILLSQDILRFSCFSLGKARLALEADVIWLVGASGTAAYLLAGAQLEASIYFVYWVSWSAISIIFMFKVARKLSRPWNVTAAWTDSRSISSALIIEAVLTLSVLYAHIVAFGRAGGVAAIGALRGAQTLYSPVNTLVALTTIILLPYIVPWEAQGRHAARERLILVAAGISAVIVSFAAILSLFPGNIGAVILGPSWRSAHDLVLPIGLGVLAAALSYLPSTLLKARGRPLLLVGASIGGATVEFGSLVLGSIAGLSPRDLAFASAVGWSGGLAIWVYAAARSKFELNPNPGVVV